MAFVEKINLIAKKRLKSNEAFRKVLYFYLSFFNIKFYKLIKRLRSRVSSSLE